MTLNKFIKVLIEIRDNGNGHKPVFVDKKSFSHALESDGAYIIGLEDANVRWVNFLDDDGGIKFNKDGSESGRNIVVLSGGS